MRKIFTVKLKTFDDRLTPPLLVRFTMPEEPHDVLVGVDERYGMLEGLRDGLLVIIVKVGSKPVGEDEMDTGAAIYTDPREFALRDFDGDKTFSGSGYSVTLTFRTVWVRDPVAQIFEDCGFRLAPELPPPPEQQQQNTTFFGALDTSTSGRSGNNISLVKEERVLCQPGRYSGDCWHVAAAMILDPELKLAVLRPPIFPFGLKITDVRWSHQVLDYQIELRSSLGVVASFGSDQVKDFYFFHAGTVEFWITAWVASGEHAIAYKQAFGAQPVKKDGTLEFELEAKYLISEKAWFAYEDECLDLPNEEIVSLKVELDLVTARIETGPKLEYPDTFIGENLCFKLAKESRPILQKFLKGVRWNIYEIEPKPFLVELEDHLLYTICGAPRRLYLDGNVPRDRRVQSWLWRSFQKFLLLKIRPDWNEPTHFFDKLYEKGEKNFQATAQSLTKVIETVLSQESSNVKTDYVLKSNQFLEFYAKCRIEDYRIGITFPEKKVAQNGSIAFHDLRRYVEKELGPDVRCGMTFSATSVLMEAVERMGITRVREILVERFTRYIDQSVKNEIAAKVEPISNLGRCVLLNVRQGGYHPEHDVTEGIYAQVKRLADRHGLKLVRVGGKRDWKNDGSVHLDIYPKGGDYIAKEVDLGHTAYLWKLIADLPNVVGIIGGMSGSFDIATYMGVRGCCWDIALKEHDSELNLTLAAERQDRVRLLLSYPFMSIIQRKTKNLIEAIEQKKTKQKDDEDDESEEAQARKAKFKYEFKDDEPQDVLDELALELWLSGFHVIPTLGDEFDPKTAVLAKSKSTDGFKAVLLYPLTKICKKLRD